MKLCKKCGQEKPEQMFYKNSKGYFCSPCKDCKTKAAAPALAAWNKKFSRERGRCFSRAKEVTILEIDTDDYA